MNHPELLLFPILALADYWLTLWNARLARQGFSSRFPAESIELNPRWQASIDSGRRLDPRFLLLVALGTLTLVALDLMAGWWREVATVAAMAPGMVLEMLAGAMLTAYAVVLGRHLTLAGTFRYVRDHPGEMAGEVRATHPMALAMSRWQILGGALVPVLLLAAVWRSLFAVGAVLGVLSLVRAHETWRRQGQAGGEGAPAAEGT